MQRLPTLTDDELEAAIDEAHEAMCRASTWRETREHQERMYRLIGQRTNQRKQTMEREQGLNQWRESDQ